MLIFMSDHGHRFAELRATEQGKLEERLPFFSIYLPPWFGKRYPEAMRNLRLNARRLTTPFDIHETLTSVLRFRTPKKGNLSERAISLFDEVPLERTCSDAGIEPHWCACLSWQTLPTTVSEVKYIANAIVAALNKVTASERQLCSKLRLRSIVKAFLLSANDAVIKYKQAKDADGFVPDLSDVNTAISRLYYQVNLVTTPGNALYEASVVWDKSINRLYIDLNTVSHINAYDEPCMSWLEHRSCEVSFFHHRYEHDYGDALSFRTVQPALTFRKLTIRSIRLLALVGRSE
ncbi:unnamed protein product [Soboliphyme baturini]|uniref:Sulfatase domain-containing protein n=1 Tax=Soboliphyme baturini TaxID=241478 RepID=A0A183IGP6_9BILA|nr:unnamed protein product [Soboliphyme baturini]